MNNVLSITSKATEQIKKIMSNAPNGMDSVVIGVDKSGCSGYSYKLDFGKSSDYKNYEVINKDGAKVLIDPKATMFLLGSVMDYREDKLAEYKKNRTIIAGFYEDKTYRGVPLPIQVFDDDWVYEMEEKANGDINGKLLSKNKTLRYFQSDTYDEDIKNGIDEEVAFVNAQDMGDWNWKEDDKEYIRYDRRFKKRRLT